MSQSGILDIEDAFPQIPTNFVADVGNAIPIANTLDLVGGSNINTSGAGKTITVNLDTSLTGLIEVDIGNIRLTGNTISTTNLNGDLIISPNGIGRVYVPSAPLYTIPFILAGGLIDYIGPLSDGELIIGNGVTGIPNIANLTSSGGTITITNGAGTINLESVGGGGADTFTTDAGNAVEVGGVINVLGGTNIATSGAGNTVTIDIDGVITVPNGGTGAGTFTDHAVLVGSGVGAITAIAVGGTGELLVGAAGADPAFGNIAYGNFSFANITAATARYLYVTNADNNAASVAEIRVSVPTAGADPYFCYEIQATAFYSHGPDNSVAGDPWKLTNSSSPSAGDALLTITNAGVVTLYNDLDVTEGGTGVGTFTAYTPICGGTTATGDLQSVAAIGNAGQILTSNGAAALPTFQDPPAGGMTYSEITAATKTIVINESYGANRAGGVAFTLPATAAIGTEFEILGILGNWSIIQPANTYIRFGDRVTTVGAGGSLTATSVGDCITCRCIVADLGWIVKASQGNITLV